MIRMGSMQRCSLSEAHAFPCRLYRLERLLHCQNFQPSTFASFLLAHPRQKTSPVSPFLKPVTARSGQKTAVSICCRAEFGLQSLEHLSQKQSIARALGTEKERSNIMNRGRQKCVSRAKHMYHFEKCREPHCRCFRINKDYYC